MLKRVLTPAVLALSLVVLAAPAPSLAQSENTTQNKPVPPKPEQALDAAAPPSSQAKKAEDGKPGPASAKDRDRILGDLYDRLAKADDPDYAKVVQTAIEKMWSFSGSDTVDLLMRRAQVALGKDDKTVAVTILNAVVGLDPDYAEGWNRRAFVHFSQKNYRAALRDLRKVLIIDPKHYKAIGGLAVILREYGRDAAALKAFRKALEINPLDPDTSKAVKDLEVEVEGQAI